MEALELGMTLGMTDQALRQVVADLCALAVSVRKGDIISSAVLLSICDEGARSVESARELLTVWPL